MRVTIVTNKRRLLAHIDAEVSDALRQQMTSRLGIAVYVLYSRARSVLEQAPWVANASSRETYVQP